MTWQGSETKKENILPALQGYTDMGHTYRDEALYYQEMCESSDKLLTNMSFWHVLCCMLEDMARQLARSLLLGTH
jgi:hypothetical protein